MAADEPPTLPVDLEEDPSLRGSEELFHWSLCGAIKATKKALGGNPVVELGSGPADLVFAPSVGGEGVGDMKWHLRVFKNKYWVLGLVPKEELEKGTKNPLITPRANDLPCIWTQEKNTYMPKEVSTKWGLERAKKVHGEFLEVWVSYTERKVEIVTEKGPLLEYGLQDEMWDGGFYLVLNGYFGTSVELALDKMASINIKG